MCPLIVDGETTEAVSRWGEGRIRGRDLHNYTVVIYDDTPDLSPEGRKFHARVQRYRDVASRLFREAAPRARTR